MSCDRLDVIFLSKNILQALVSEVVLQKGLYLSIKGNDSSLFAKAIISNSEASIVGLHYLEIQTPQLTQLN